MSNQIPVMNRVIGQWLNPPQGLAPAVDCANCSRATFEPDRAARWRDYKCCAFQPFIANFYCGAMLEAGVSPLPAAAQAVAQPIGVLATREFRNLCDATPDRNRTEAHLCAYYKRESRQCGIWQFRPGECSLYYCTNDDNKAARERWSERAFAFETNVAQMALVYAGFSPGRIAEQVTFLNEPPLGLASVSDVLEVYRACWDWVKSQSREDLLAFDIPPGRG